MPQISAKAFLPPHNIEFRTSHDTSKHSECLLVCVDLWKEKLGRIVMAPRARVAYTVGDYVRRVSCLAVLTATELGEEGR